jgi:hypothetical protein
MEPSDVGRAAMKRSRTGVGTRPSLHAYEIQLINIKLINDTGTETANGWKKSACHVPTLPPLSRE